VSFLAWTFLFGAVAVVGPVVAHLLSKPRFRRVPFTMLRFLRAGQSHSHSRRRLRDLLILLLRCAIIVLIAILFAQPVLHVRVKPPAQRAVYHLALDDSMSMAYRDGNRTLFERMIEKALDAVRQAPEDATFSIYGLASGRSSHGLLKSEAITTIRQLNVVPASVRLSDFFSALGQARRAAGPDDVISATILSDFTPSVIHEFEQVQAPAAVDEIHCEPVVPEKPAENTAIVAARIAGRVGNKLNLDVTVAHYGPAPRQCTITAQLADHSATCRQDLSLVPGQHKVVRLQMDPSTGSHGPDRPCLPIELSLPHEDGLAEDDTYRIAVYVPRAGRTNVVLVHRAEESFLFETAIQALSSSGSLDRLSLKKVPQGQLTARDLDGADIAVFSSLPSGPSVRAGDLKAFTQRGGRLVFFTAGVQDLEPAKLLSREGLLAAQPQRWVQALAYPEPRPSAGVSFDLDEQAARSLSNYRLDQVALKGYWLCQPAAQAECLWRLNAGEGLIYGMPCAHGLSMFVNTSIDDSLGLLAKSAAWVAFCRGLIGETDETRQFCFSTGERPVLHIADRGMRSPESGAGGERTAISVENCDGSKARAASQGNVLLLPPPAGTGWMKTLNGPAFYAAINLPTGETDLTAPTPERIADLVQRSFVQTGDRRPEAGGAYSLRPAASGLHPKPVWPIFAWAAMALLVLESAIANRLKR
jgi:hypothetical protein